jgi:hypothetical protein
MEGMATGFRLRGFCMALTIDTGGRVRQHLETRRWDLLSAPRASAVRAFGDSIQRGADLLDRNTMGGRCLEGDGIHARKGVRREVLEDGQPFLELPLEFALYAREGGGVSGSRGHGVLLGYKKTRRRCDALVSG